jgi:hypothetical protein
MSGVAEASLPKVSAPGFGLEAGIAAPAEVHSSAGVFI